MTLSKNIIYQIESGLGGIFQINFLREENDIFYFKREARGDWGEQIYKFSKDNLNDKVKYYFNYYDIKSFLKNFLSYEESNITYSVCYHYHLMYDNIDPFLKWLYEYTEQPLKGYSEEYKEICVQLNEKKNNFIKNYFGF